MISGGGMETSEMKITSESSCPYVEIVEQPASKALRFRYKCEGRSAGSIPGANSTPEVKTCPTIRIVGYQGRGIVVVSCVTKDHPYRPHPHSLVGKDTCKTGVCRMEITPDNQLVSFTNLGIQCVKKKDIAEALRVRQEIRVDPFRTGFEHALQPTDIDLNSVRLCFQVFIEGRDGKINLALRPVVSEPIYDKKAICDLMICKMSHYSATVAGGMEMVILCEKVAKDNIKVKFFEKRDGVEVWEGYGDFKSIHVHKQVAIAFRTPSYRHRQVDEPVQVYVQLKRPTDGGTSEPLPFKLLPLGADDHDFLRKKRRKFEESPRALVLRHIQAEAERQGALLNEPPIEYNFDPLKLEARVRSFPVGTPISAPGVQSLYGTVRNPSLLPVSPLVDVPSYGEQASPVGQTSPPMGYAHYEVPYAPNQQRNANEPFEAAHNNQGCQQQSLLNIHQIGTSQCAGYCQQQQTQQRQQDLVLQKISMTQHTAHRNNNNHTDLDGAIGNASLVDVNAQQHSFDATLNQLDSAELAAFGIALSETLSSGLSITDHPVKMEPSTAASSTMPVSVGAAASWCDM